MKFETRAAFAYPQYDQQQARISSEPRGLLEVARDDLELDEETMQQLRESVNYKMERQFTFETLDEPSNDEFEIAI